MFGLFSKRKQNDVPADPPTDPTAAIIFNYLASKMTAAGILKMPGVLHPRYQNNYIVFSANSYILGAICGMCKTVIVKRGTQSLSEDELRRQLLAMWIDMVMRLLGKQMGEWAVMGAGALSMAMPFDTVAQMQPDFARGILDGANEALAVLSGQKPPRSFLDGRSS
jgi:hypothetical protein